MHGAYSDNTLSLSYPLYPLAHPLASAGIHRLPLVSRDGRCTGMLTRNDIFRPVVAADPLGMKWAAAEKTIHPEKDKGH